MALRSIVPRPVRDLLGPFYWRYLEWRSGGRSAQEPLRQNEPSGRSFEQALYERVGLEALDGSVDPTMRMWVEYALGSAGRGFQTVEALGGVQAFKGKTVLDVGCGYGGSLIAAWVNGAQKVSGVDIDPSLAELARKQLDDFNTEADVRVVDIMDDTQLARLGTFDVVMCSGVIEHVRDPGRLIRQLAELTEPGGMVSLVIPNAQALDLIISDGHYQVFGLTTLDRRDAESWFRHESTAGPYGMELYAPLDYYLSLCSDSGFTTRVLQQPPEDIDSMVDALERTAASIESQLSALDRPSVDPSLLDELRRRISVELDTFADLALRFRRSDHQPERDILGRTLWLRYQLADWSVQGWRSGDPG